MIGITRKIGVVLLAIALCAGAARAQSGQLPNNTVWGNVSGGRAPAGPLTATQLTTLCNLFSATLPGCAPLSGGGTANFLRADGAWSPLTVGATGIGSGTTLRVLYDNGGTLGEYTNTQLTALINPATASLSGALPAWPNTTTTFFRGDGSYQTLNCAALTNGAASCSTDTTNASNISNGTLAAARGGAGTINGALKGNGAGVVSQAACADLSNGAASCSTDATNASNISSGTLGVGRFPVGANSGNFVSETGDFTVQTTDCNKTFQFSATAAQHTVTAAAASGFSSGCRFWIINTGVYTGSGSARGLLMSSISGASFPTQGFVLYPGQYTEFTNIGSTWVETGYSWRQRWKPNANITFFADASSGSDNNDCLASGASACATIGNPYYRAFNYVDNAWLGISNLNPMVLLSTNGTFSSGDTLHLAGPLPGGGNNTVFALNGNGTTTMTSSSGQPCIAMFDHSVMEVINLTCNGTVGNAGCFTVASGAVMFFITTGVVCDPGTANGITVQDPGSKAEIVNVNLTFNSASGIPASLFVASQGGAIVWDNAESISLGANMAFSAFTVTVTELGLLHFAGTTFNLNAHTITGTRFFCTRFSVIQGSGGTPNTFFPGNANGTAGSDCSAT